MKILINFKISLSILVFLVAIPFVYAMGPRGSCTVNVLRSTELGNIDSPTGNTVYTIAPVESPADGISGKFEADGDDGLDFEAEITDTSVDLDRVGGGATITIDSFLIGDGSSSSSIYNGTFPSGSSVTLYIGCDFSIAAGQMEGTYTGTAQLQVQYTTSPAKRERLDVTFTVVIVETLELSILRNLYFGIIVSPVIATNYTVQPDNSITAQGGQSAMISVNGTDGLAYDVDIQNSSIILTSGVNNMTVDTFLIGDGTTSGATYSGTFASPDAATSLFIGATCHVGADQASGTYTGTNTVILSYQ